MTIHYQVKMSVFTQVLSVLTTFSLQRVLLFIVRDGDTVKHYRIRQLDDGGFFIARRITFRSLAQLVDHYSRDPDGLCVNLRKACSQVRFVINFSSHTKQEPELFWFVDW